MKGPTFKTKIDYFGIKADSIVQGVSMAGDGMFGGTKQIGVATTDMPADFPICAGFEPESPMGYGKDGTRGGWFYNSTDLEPLTAEAEEFVAAHLAEGGL